MGRDGADPSTMFAEKCPQRLELFAESGGLQRAAKAMAIEEARRRAGRGDSPESRKGRASAAAVRRAVEPDRAMTRGLLGRITGLLG